MAEMLRTAPRIRRSKEQARSEILAAARLQLEQDGPAGLSVAAVMARTGMTRKTFYVHFSDRSSLIRELVQPFRVDLDAAMARWRSGLDPVKDGFAALQEAARTYRAHNAVLRALWWTTIDDLELATVRSELNEPLVAVGAALIRRERGLPEPQARAIAVVLATMNVHTLLALGSDPSDNQLTQTLSALRTVWVATVLGNSVPQQPAPPGDSGPLPLRD